MEQDKLFPFTECEQYVSLLQDNINRMANNSRNCKNWLISLIVGLCAIQVADVKMLQYLWIAYIPIGLFFFLDCLYLGIERRLRGVEKYVIDQSIKGELRKDDLYKFNFPKEHKSYRSILCTTINAIWSFSTTPFYLTVLAIIIIIQKFIQ